MVKINENMPVVIKYTGFLTSFSEKYSIPDDAQRNQRKA